MFYLIHMHGVLMSWGIKPFITPKTHQNAIWSDGMSFGEIINKNNKAHESVTFGRFIYLLTKSEGKENRSAQMLLKYKM